MKIKDIKARLDAIGSNNWRVELSDDWSDIELEHEHYSVVSDMATTFDFGAKALVVLGDDPRYEKAEDIVQFIAHAPRDIKHLLSVVADMRSMLVDFVDKHPYDDWHRVEFDFDVCRYCDYTKDDTHDPGCPYGRAKKLLGELK